MFIHPNISWTSKDWGIVLVPARHIMYILTARWYTYFLYFDHPLVYIFWPPAGRSKKSAWHGLLDFTVSPWTSIGGPPLCLRPYADRFFKHGNGGVSSRRLVLNPFLPTDLTFAVRETYVSLHNGGTSGAPLKPLRVDSALRALLYIPLNNR